MNREDRGARGATVEEIHRRIMRHKTEIIRATKKAVNRAIRNRRLDDYRVVWKQLQTIAIPEVKQILEREFRGATFVVTESKSTYPDLKMVYRGKTIAFDIKSNEAQKEPWYDIARLDTIDKERLSKYDEEYDLIVKYDRESGRLLEVYFDLMRQTVGKNSDCDGVKFRPYDGKLRPKSWEDFENGTGYWSTIDAFKKGIRRSQIHRWKKLIKETLVPTLSIPERGRFRALFD